MSTSGNERAGFGRAAVVYLCISVFCGFFAVIYAQFSHGVHSPYMTWLLGWPFVLGVLPGVFFRKCGAVRAPGRVSFNLWNSGVAALTVSSMLRGIFKIAGTASDYQVWLMYAGGAMLVMAGIAYLFRK